MIHYAENDERINAMWPAFETALKANGIAYEMHIYPGTQHGFQIRRRENAAHPGQAAAHHPGQRGGKKADEHVGGEALRGGIARQAHHGGQQALQVHWVHSQACEV